MRLSLLLSVWTFSIFAVHPPVPVTEPGEEDAWFTGPLIAQSPLVVPKGHVNIEPYLSATAVTGIYNGQGKTQTAPTLWNINLEPQMIFGLTPQIDLYVLPSI